LSADQAAPPHRTLSSQATTPRSAGFVLVRLPITLLLLLGAGDFSDARAQAAVDGQSSTPGRALWVVRNTLASREETERAVRDCERIRCSLLFLQVSGRWDAYFPSSLFPPGQAWAQEEDNLARAIELAHARGIRVHAWVNSLLGWAAADPPRDRDHIFYRHPEWFLVGKDGRSILSLSRRELDRRRIEGYFLEPRLPAVRSELRRLLLELVTRYPLDGVHLDYIRLPSSEWGFHDELRARYRVEAGIDPLELYSRERELKAARGASGLEEARAAWQAWHREGVSQLVRLIAADLKSVRPELELSAAVLANPRSARDDFGQDWLSWLEEGTLSLAVPMVYRSSARQVLESLQAIHRLAARDHPLYAGVSLEFLRPGEIPPVEGLMGRYGADGLAIFSYNLLGGDRRALELLARR
jgi:uncharacterized lipoprotein YddW (UPF0748 family)